MDWMYELYEWTWHLGTFGNVLWATYLGLNVFGYFTPLFLATKDIYDEHPYRNTFGVWGVQIGLFFTIGGIGYLIYNI